MADTVRLLSTKGRAQLIETFYFYDGETPIKDGVVEIPVDRPEWVQRAYIMGYRHDPVTEEVITLDEALAGGRVPAVAEAPVATTETPEGDVDGEQSEDGLAVELEGDETVGVPEPEGEGADEAVEEPGETEDIEPQEV